MFALAFSGPIACAGPTFALDIFGLFGNSEKKPPLTQASSPYSLTFEGLSAALKQDLQDVSALYRLRDEAPADGDAIVRLAEVDLPRLIDVMWGNGFYAARVDVEIAGVRIGIRNTPGAAAARAADQLRGRGYVPVRVLVQPGPQYTFGHVRIVDAATGRPFPPDVVPPRIEADVSGAPARTATLVAAADQVSLALRRRGHPLVKVKDPQPVIDHRTHKVQITLEVTPGPVAKVGAVTVTGNKNIHEEVIRSFIYGPPGVLYTPEMMNQIRRSVGQIEAVGAVRIRETEKLDPDGTLPIEVNVAERPLRVLGGSASYSTIDGPAVNAYWAHRNLFGGAERLRFDASLFYLNRGLTLPPNASKFERSDLGGRFAMGFMKPALGGSRVDFLFDARVERTRTDAYVNRLGNAVAALRYRLAEKAWVQVGLEGEVAHTTDIFGARNYQLLGVPLSANWDTTDNKLDPTRGFRITGSITPYKGFGQMAPYLVAAKLAASAYYALDAESRYILAGRLAVASVSGGSIGDIPANRRLFAGGGGSVRGYEYLSLGPRDPFGRLIGGRSLVEASLEARIRVTDTIGVVPFIDAGNAFTSPLPDFRDKLRFAAGVGLRYYTAIGLIRLDVATPLDRRRGETPIGLYISLGQAF